MVRGTSIWVWFLGAFCSVALVGAVVYALGALLIVAAVPAAGWWCWRVWKVTAPPTLAPEVQARLREIRETNERMELAERARRAPREPVRYRTTFGRSRRPR